MARPAARGAGGASFLPRRANCGREVAQFVSNRQPRALHGCVRG